MILKTLSPWSMAAHRSSRNLSLRRLRCGRSSPLRGRAFGTGTVPALLEAHLGPDEASQARAGLVLSRIEAMSRIGHQ